MGHEGTDEGVDVDVDLCRPKTCDCSNISCRVIGSVDQTWLGVKTFPHLSSLDLLPGRSLSRNRKRSRNRQRYGIRDHAHQPRASATDRNPPAAVADRKVCHLKEEEISLDPSPEELEDVILACAKLWDLDRNRLTPGEDFQMNIGHGQ